MRCMLQHSTFIIRSLCTSARPYLHLLPGRPVIERPVYRLQLNGRFRRSTCYIYFQVVGCCWFVAVAGCLLLFGSYSSIEKREEKNNRHFTSSWCEQKWLFYIELPTVHKCFLFTLSIYVTVKRHCK